MMRRGEIRWYRFAPPDKRRPALILTRNPVIASFREIPSEVALSIDDGMPRDCAVNCDHLQTVPQAKLGALLTTLLTERMYQVTEAIRFALALR